MALASMNPTTGETIQEYQEWTDGEVTEKYEHIFGISAVVSEGDSGSPVLFVRDGKLGLGGVDSFIVLPARGLGYSLKINPIIERLKNHGENLTWLLPLLESGR
jgi:hypothetical protein